MGTPTERRRAKRRSQSRIDNLLTIAIVGTIGVVIWINWPRSPTPPVPLPATSLALDPKSTKGSPTAQVALITYADFECRYCGEFARETMPAVVREYVDSGKVRLAYGHVTPSNHRRAIPAAIAAECAGEQGKFWEMHDRIFARQADLDDTSLTAHAGALGLDLSAFTACQAAPATADRIAIMTAESRKLHIRSTPSFFIGRIQPDGRVRVTRSFRGAVPLQPLREALDLELDQGFLGSIVRHLAGLVGAALVVVAVGIGLALRGRRSRVTN